MHIQETVNLFDPITVSVAHQKALQMEKQLSWRSSNDLLINTSSNTGGANHSTSGNRLGKDAPTTVA